MKNLNGVAASVAAVALMAAPSLAAADTISDLQSQIQSLLAQAKTLQMQLFTLRASSTASSTRPKPEDRRFATSTPPGKMIACMRIERAIRLGDRGDDVRDLQEFLREHGDVNFTASSTGTFGPVTAAAMARWQARMGIASSTDGSVGPATRAFLARKCGDAMQDKKEAGFGFGLGKIKNMIGSMLPRDIGDASGAITEADSSHLVLRTPDGRTRSVTISGSTTISVFSASSTRLVPGTVADLIVGRMTKVIGTRNSDGSLTATDIKVSTAAALQRPERPMIPKPMRDLRERMHGRDATSSEQR